MELELENFAEIIKSLKTALSIIKEAASNEIYGGPSKGPGV